VGIRPYKEFIDKSTVSRFTRFPTSDGIDPFSLDEVRDIETTMPEEHDTPNQFPPQTLTDGFPPLQIHPARPLEETLIDEANLHMEMFCTATAVIRNIGISYGILKKNR